MSPIMEKQRSSPDEEVDYNPLLGFVTPAVHRPTHARYSSPGGHRPP